ncbi:metallophosphoesterase family protein [Paenibacillus alkalitolerans]|uniref:metallophosphoesterase family protein n=1 Tax=Paenibacillus alkalitolerans TaxID=2799335 RepID=UPI0018F607CD|nr:metallophosphoesterase family protein [Paenibacillus alkalitolerans]
MRLAVISDTHGNATAFEAVVRDIKNQSPDAIVFLGDIVMRGPQPGECIKLVKSLQPLSVIRGNYDNRFTRFPKPGWTPSNYKQELVLRAFEYDCERISKEEQVWLANLPTELSCNFEEVPTEMYHASPNSLVDIVYPWATLDELDTLHKNEQTKLVLYGHVHHAHVRQGRGRLVVNCGSIGLPFDGDNRASYAIVDFNKKDIAVQLRRVSYDIEKAIIRAKECNMPDIDAFEYALRRARYPYDSVKRSHSAT